MAHICTRCGVAASALILSLFVLSCGRDPQTDDSRQLDEELEQLLVHIAPGASGLDFFRMPESDDLDRIPQDPFNRLTPQKVALGQMLFHETALGRVPQIPQSMQTYSCTSCHHAAAGFQACLSQGIGEGGVGFGLIGEGRTVNPAYPLDSIDVQPVRSPSAMNGAWQEVMLWNGQFGAQGHNAGTQFAWTPGTPKEKNVLGYQGLETQAIAGQNVHRLKVDSDWVLSIPAYKSLFDAAYPDIPASERYTNITAGLAIAAYERTLLANQSPWQNWLNGSHSAMSNAEKEGAILFFGKAGCVACHTGPALNSMSFHALGMGDLQNGNYGAINITDDRPEHKGRGGFTGKDQDKYCFKVPQIYNLKDSPFYGHGATFTSIRDVVEYKNKGVSQNDKVPAAYLSPLFKPLNLTAAEVDALALYLEKSLRDPNLFRYVPKSLPSGLCFPNNDPQSRIDQGCQ